MMPLQWMCVEEQESGAGRKPRAGTMAANDSRNSKLTSIFFTPGYSINCRVGWLQGIEEHPRVSLMRRRPTKKRER